MYFNKALSYFQAASVASVLALVPIPSFAQSEGDTRASAHDEEDLLPEIKVTVRRYEESLQGTPVAVNVMSSDYIQEHRVRLIDDVTLLTPGASFNVFSRVNPTYSVRGVVSRSSGNPSGDSSVQTVVDDAVISVQFMENPVLFDMERVEVLRGPQGTSFGRNASIGLMHLITSRPTQDFEAAVNVTAGSDDLFETDGYISGPLSNTVSARLAYNFDSMGGHMRDDATSTGIDGTKNSAVRLSLLFEPNDNLSVFLKGEYNEDSDDAPVKRAAGCAVPQAVAGDDAVLRAQLGLNFTHPPYSFTFYDSCDPFRTTQSSGDFFFDREIITVMGEVVWDFAEGYTLTSVTSYMDGEFDGLADALGTPFNLLFQNIEQHGDALTQEFRLDNHNSGSRISWLAGAMYLTNESFRGNRNQFFFPDPTSGPQGENPFPFPRVPTQVGDLHKNETESVAIFGEASFDVTDRLNATFGVRWTQDEKDYTARNVSYGFAPILRGIEGCDTSPVCGTPDDPVGFDATTTSRKWDDTIFKGSLQFQANDDHMIYGLISQGFKSGGFQFGARTAQTIRDVSFDPERSTNYELGWKGEIADRFRFSVAGFILENKDTQLSQFVQVGDGFFQLFTNAGEVESVGLDGEATWAITSNTLLTGTFNVMDVQLKDTLIVTTAGEAPTDFSGTRPDLAPKWTGSIVASHDINLANGSVITLRGDGIFRSNMFDNLGELAARERPEQAIFNARVDWRSANGRLRLSVWGENLSEDIDYVSFSPFQPNTVNLAQDFRGKRAWGAEIGYQW